MFSGKCNLWIKMQTLHIFLEQNQKSYCNECMFMCVVNLAPECWRVWWISRSPGSVAEGVFRPNRLSFLCIYYNAELKCMNSLKGLAVQFGNSIICWMIGTVGELQMVQWGGDHVCDVLFEAPKGDMIMGVCMTGQYRNGKHRLGGGLMVAALKHIGTMAHSRRDVVR